MTVGMLNRDLCGLSDHPQLCCCLVRVTQLSAFPPGRRMADPGCAWLIKPLSCICLICGAFAVIRPL